MIIGISGTFSSGKDTVAEYLADLGFAVVSTSDLLREEMRKRKKRINRKALVEMANQLEVEWGEGSLARIAYENNKHKQDLVITGIRKISEIEYLRTIPGFFLVFIDAPIETRYIRVVKRGREGEGKLSLEEFKKQENLEMSGGSSQRLDYCRENADMLLMNDGNLEQLVQKVDAMIAESAKAM